MMEIELKAKAEIFYVNTTMFHPKVAKTVHKLVKKIKINFRLLMILSIVVMYQATNFWFCNRDRIVIFWVLNQQFNYSGNYKILLLQIIL